MPQSNEAIEKNLERLLRLVDGDPAYRITGLVDRLDAVIKADSEWKRATEEQLGNHTRRLDVLEGKRHLYITYQMAAFLVFAGAGSLVLAYWFLSLLQGAG